MGGQSEDRRQNWVCGAHHELVASLNTINDKLDSMIERQIEYAERSVRIEAKQERLESIVTNGLSHNVANIAKRLDSFCDEVKRRLDVLEDFSWFRKPVTAWRDNFFLNALKLAMLGALVYVVVHFSGELIKVVLR